MKQVMEDGGLKRSRIDEIVFVGGCTNDEGSLTEEQIEKTKNDALQFADVDKKVRKRVDAKHARYLNAKLNMWPNHPFIN